MVFLCAVLIQFSFMMTYNGQNHAFRFYCWFYEWFYKGLQNVVTALNKTKKGFITAFKRGPENHLRMVPFSFIKAL